MADEQLRPAQRAAERRLRQQRHAQGAHGYDDEGVNDMGVEHTLQNRLWIAGTTGKALMPLLPMSDDGNLRQQTPNQKMQTVALWVLESLLAGDKARARAAVKWAMAYLQTMAREGHMSTAPGGTTEILTSSHAQLWYAGYAGLLWAAALLGDDELMKGILREWRIETALVGKCWYHEPDGTFRVLVACTRGRDGKTKTPDPFNSLRDRVIEALLPARAGGSPWERPPETPKHGDYDAAVPLLKRAFATGVAPSRLIGSEIDLPARFVFNYKGAPDANYYSWFSAGLEGAYDALWGAGHVDGVVVLKWDRDEAAAFGESRS